MEIVLVTQIGPLGSQQILALISALHLEVLMECGRKNYRDRQINHYFRKEQCNSARLSVCSSSPNDPVPIDSCPPKSACNATCSRKNTSEQTSRIFQHIQLVLMDMFCSKQHASAID